tara:strand:+ start:447 stop:698 length:252 start_codon:yes stop_codon:yes gene_type:complete
MTNEEIDKRNEEISKANSEKIAAELKSKFSNLPCFTYLEFLILHDAVLLYMRSIEEGLYLYDKLENLAYIIDYCLENELYNKK